MSLVIALLGALRASLRTRTDLALENLALGQQLRPASPPIEATAIRAPRASLLDVALRPLGGVGRGAPCRSPQDRDSLAPVVCQNPVTRLDDTPAACEPGGQCPSQSLCWARCVRRSKPALTSRSRT